MCMLGDFVVVCKVVMRFDCILFFLHYNMHLYIHTYTLFLNNFNCFGIVITIHFKSIAEIILYSSVGYIQSAGSRKVIGTASGHIVKADYKD